MCFLLLAVVFETQAQTTFTLREAIGQAIKVNPQVKQAELNTLKTAQQVRETKSMGLPQANAYLNYDDNVKIATQILPGEIVGRPGSLVPVQFGTKYNVTMGAEVQQLIYSQAYWAGIKAIKQVENFNQLEIKSAKEEIIFQVTQTYYLAQVMAKQRDIIKANLDKTTKLLLILETQYAQGVIQKIDLDRLKVAETNLQTEAENLELAYQQQLNLLKYMTATPIEMQVSLADTIQTLGILPTADRANTQSRLAIQILQKQKDLENLQIKVTQAGYYPTLMAFARYNNQAQRNSWNFFKGGEAWFDFSTIGLRLNVPIFDGFAKQSRVQQSKIRLQSLDIQIANQNNFLQMEYANIQHKLKNQQTIINKQQANMKLAEQVYQTTQIQYQNGVTPLAELLNAETALREAQTNYFTSLIQTKITELEFIRSNGKLLDLLTN
jgi:outer membrane protein